MVHTSFSGIPSLAIVPRAPVTEIGEDAELMCGKPPLRRDARQATLEASERKEITMLRKLQRILVAVDDDPVARSVIEHGVALAAAEGAELTFVHVAAIVGEGFTRNGSVHRVPDRLGSTLLRSALACAGDAGITGETELLVGFAPEQIAALADELDADLIVVGSHHYTGAKRLLHGSTSRALLDATRRPLMIVTEPVREPARV
jgi:nucleotide-binding universal stress UspA family protein